MAGLKQTEIKVALKKRKLNFKIQNSKLNTMIDSVTLIDKYNKAKIRGKIVQSFSEGEVHYWPLLKHENIARLINVLLIRDDIYIYLTAYHETTLKNIVHDASFLYDCRCFDRKRSYAKGIFSGLNYLHEKSLFLMNICDDNIIISSADDRAIITNFEHLTTSQKAKRSKLNVPEMYMAPETDANEFDALKAEIWASGILMLDMFLAHMVPWGFINYKHKNVIKIVDKLSLPIFQAANAGSIVSAADLATFRTFLRCFLKQNPQERMPAKYACLTSFLQNSYQYNIFEDSCAVIPLPEYLLTENYTNFKLAEGDMTICFNSINDPTSYFLSTEALKTKTSDTDFKTYNLTTERQQTKKCNQIVENKRELDIVGTSGISVKMNKIKNIPSILSSKSFIPYANTNVRSEFHKTKRSQSCNEPIKCVTKPSSDCCQTENLIFKKSGKNGNITAASSLFSMTNSHHSNNKCSSKTKEKGEKNEEKSCKNETANKCIKRISEKIYVKEKMQNSIKKPKWWKFFAMIYERRDKEQLQLLLHP